MLPRRRGLESDVPRLPANCLKYIYFNEAAFFGGDRDSRVVRAPCEIFPGNCVCMCEFKEELCGWIFFSVSAHG